MSREETNILKYCIAVVSEFAASKKLTPKQAFNYLLRFKGMQYLESYYDVLHTLSFEDAIEAMTSVCRQNGGKIL